VDITYIPMARGFVYLAVVLDWFLGFYNLAGQLLPLTTARDRSPASAGASTCSSALVG
jgi:hypothetical protein